MPDPLRAEHRPERLYLDLRHGERHALPVRPEDGRPGRVPPALARDLYAGDRIRRSGQRLDVQLEFPRETHRTRVRVHHQTRDGRRCFGAGRF